jgi:hypothetical protein
MQDLQVVSPADVMQQPPLKRVRLELEVDVPVHCEFVSAEQLAAISAYASTVVLQQEVVFAPLMHTAAPLMATHAAAAAASASADSVTVYWFEAMPEHVRNDVANWQHNESFGVSQVKGADCGDNILRTWTAPSMSLSEFKKGLRSNRNICMKPFSSSNGTEVPSMKALGIDLGGQLSDIAARMVPLINACAYDDNATATANAKTGSSDSPAIVIRAIEFEQLNTPALECRESASVVPNTRLHYTFVRICLDVVIVVPTLLCLDAEGGVEVLVDKLARRIGSRVFVSSTAASDDSCAVFSGAFERFHSGGRRTPAGLVSTHKSWKSSPALIGSRASDHINACFGAGFLGTPLGKDDADVWTWAASDGLDGKSTKGTTMAPIPFAIFLAHYILWDIATNTAHHNSPAFEYAAKQAWTQLNLSYKNEEAVMRSEGDNFGLFVQQQASVFARSTLLVDADRGASANWQFSRTDISSDRSVANSRSVTPTIVLQTAEAAAAETAGGVGDFGLGDGSNSAHTHTHDLGAIFGEIDLTGAIAEDASTRDEFTTPRATQQARDVEVWATITVLRGGGSGRRSSVRRAFETPSQDAFAHLPDPVIDAFPTFL